MNPSFFGLEGHPFDRGAEAEGEVFLSDAHEALTAELHAGLKAPHGITLLIGDEGSGKSTLACAFAAQLADSATVAYLPTTGPGLRHLLTEIIEQLGGTDSAATEEQALLDELTRLARARAEHDRITLIILDDAHELPAKTIERLGKLFGDDPAEPSMLHIILVGRGELLDRMNAANDRSILKHLVQVCRMDPIGPEESFRYIADRITKVGGVVDSLFTEDALHMIVKRANGFPARIDAICTASLDYAEGRGDANVGTDIVDLACSGVDGFAIEESANPAGTASYFLADDEEEAASPEPPAEEPVAREAAAPSRSTRMSSSMHEESDPAAAGGRRRLAMWAIGLIGVVGLFAATMSGTAPDDGLSGVGSGAGAQPIAALVPEDKVDPDKGIAAKPTAAPKLSMNKAPNKGTKKVSAPAPTAATPTQAQKKQEILESLQENAAPRRATAPVHASPAKPAAGAPAATANAAATGQPQAKAEAVPTAQAPKAPTPAAAPAGQQVASARPRVQSPRYAPAQNTRPQVPTPAAKSAPQPSTASTAASQAMAAAQAAAAPTKPRPVAPQATTPPKPAPTAPRAAAPRAPATPKAPEAPVFAAPASKKPAAPAPTRVAAAPAPAKASETLPRKYYTVQLGAFGSRANAETLLAKVRTKYSDGRILATTVSGKPVFRVVSGTFTEIGDAKGRATALETSGYKTYVRAVGK